MKYEIFFYVAAACFLVVVFVLLLIFVNTTARGQDMDPRYYCLYANQYPFNELCIKQKINELYNQLDQKVKEWNTNHTSFKMTPTLNNETRLLQVCIIYKINDTKCNMIYGDITN